MSMPFSKSNREIQKKLIASINDFSFSLFQVISSRQSDVNFFLSPFSVFSALAMLYNGAGETTGKEMAKALQISDPEPTTFNQAFSQLWEELQKPETASGRISSWLAVTAKELEEGDRPAYQLEIANSLWLRQEMAFHPKFLDDVQHYYHTEASIIDFEAPAAPNVINQWVKEKTKGKIPSIIDRMDPLTMLLLLNAVYFKGQWKYPFDKAKTKPGDFNLPDGRKVRLPMMHMGKSQELSYLRTREFQAVSLPYGWGRMSMYIFLPFQKVGLNSFLPQLTAANWQMWLSRFDTRPGRVVLPRFELKYDTSLNDSLQKLGMEQSFNPVVADFSRLTTQHQKACVSEVRHKTFLEVNEEGSEAAAVTSVSVVAASFVKPPSLFNMIVDRPFFCAIRDNATGVLLFMGAIVDPE